HGGRAKATGMPTKTWAWHPTPQAEGRPGPHGQGGEMMGGSEVSSGASLNRRAFLGAALAAASGRASRAGAENRGPARPPAGAAARAVGGGVGRGGMGGRWAVVGARPDRPARMVVEYATTDAFRDARRVVGPAALPETNFTAKTVLTGLPHGQKVVYRVRFQ